MSKEILLVVDAVSNEKGVSKDVIFDALEAALASAGRKLSDVECDVRVAIDRETGEYETFRRWEVIEDDTEMEFEDAQLFLAAALEIDPEIELGGFIEEPIENAGFGRIAAQTAKQVIIQKIREAERDALHDEYEELIGDMITGVIQRFDGGVATVQLSNVEAILPRSEQIPGETHHPNER